MRGPGSHATSPPPSPTASLIAPRHSKQAINQSRGFARLVGDSCSPSPLGSPGVLQMGRLAFIPRHRVELKPWQRLQLNSKKPGWAFRLMGPSGIFSSPASIHQVREGKLGSSGTHATSPAPSQGIKDGSGEGTLSCESPITFPQRKALARVSSTRSLRGTGQAGEGEPSPGMGSGTISHGLRNHQPSPHGRGPAGREQAPQGSTGSP